MGSAGAPSRREEGAPGIGSDREAPATAASTDSHRRRRADAACSAAPFRAGGKKGDDGGGSGSGESDLEKCSMLARAHGLDELRERIEALRCRRARVIPRLFIGPACGGAGDALPAGRAAADAGGAGGAYVPIAFEPVPAARTGLVESATTIPIDQGAVKSGKKLARAFSASAARLCARTISSRFAGLCELPASDLSRHLRAAVEDAERTADAFDIYARV